MEEGDYDAMYAYAALNRYHMMPWEYAALPDTHKIMLNAMLDEKAKQKKKEAEKLKNHGR